MELAISAVTGDIASRLIAFLMNKYTYRVSSSEEKMERLQQLMRVRLVIEEVDLRYITKILYAHIATDASGNHINIQYCIYKRMEQ
jgi:hypothetical protein